MQHWNRQFREQPPRLLPLKVVQIWLDKAWLIQDDVGASLLPLGGGTGDTQSSPVTSSSMIFAIIFIFPCTFFIIIMTLSDCFECS